MSIETLDPADFEPLYADSISVHLCDDCNSAHLEFFDEDETMIATAAIPAGEIEWLIGELQKCLKESGARCAAPEGVQ